MLMTVSFKAFRADIKHCLHNIANSDSYRTTGDCTIHRDASRD